MVRFAIGLILALLAVGDVGEVAAGFPLSRHELKALRTGEILFRPEVPPGPYGSTGIGGTALVYLRSDPETVWEILLDFPGHTGLFPRVKEARVIEKSGDRTLVGYRVTVGVFSFRFFINNYPDAKAHVLRWELDQSRDSDLFQDHWGYWKLDQVGDGVLVTYAMGARTTLPTFLTRGAGQTGTVETVKALKARVEGRGPLYSRAIPLS